MLAEDDPCLSPEQRRETVSLVMSGASACLEMVNDWLLLMKLQNGRMELEAEPGPLEPLVRTLVGSRLGAALIISALSRGSRWNVLWRSIDRKRSGRAYR